MNVLMRFRETAAYAIRQMNVALNFLQHLFRSCLDHEDDEHGEYVQRDPEEVEEGEGDEGDVGVQDVLGGGEDEGGEGGQGDHERGRGPQEGGEGLWGGYCFIYNVIHVIFEHLG